MVLKADGDFTAVREAHKIKSKALAVPLDENWSKAIRAGPARHRERPSFSLMPWDPAAEPRRADNLRVSKNHAGSGVQYTSRSPPLGLQTCQQSDNLFFNDVHT